MSNFSDTDKNAPIANGEGENRVGNTPSSEKIEFEFAVGIPKTALVFEEGDGAEDEILTEDITEITPKNSLSLAEDEREDEKVYGVTSAEARKAEDEEFVIPENFMIGEELSSPLGNEGAPLIWTTYVPRFTEVSEKNYTFIDEEETLRREKIKKAKIENAGSIGIAMPVYDEKSASQKTAEKSVTAEAITAGEETVSTAETDNAADLKEAVVVSIHGKPKPDKDAISVFKFGKSDIEKTPEPTEEEIEEKTIAELTGHKFNEEEIAEKKEISESEEVEESGEAISPEAREIPHPSKMFKEAYTTPSEDELPENERPKGYQRKLDPLEKGGNEYTYFNQREKFKDRFLDSKMAVKVRLTVAVLLAFIALVFENISLVFGDFYKTAGLETPISVGAIDLALVVGMFLLALPEALRGISSLKRGIVSPEISVILSAGTVFLYTLVACSVNSLEIPIMFGAVYGVSAVSAIWSTHALVSGDFTAFKTVSEKGDKYIVDIRETRTLDRENMALDGAIDESRSKIGREFKTAFVSDFFKSTQDRAENGKNNAVILGVTYGIAAVLGTVMFFIGDGIVSALSAVALVVSIAIPAFSILSHKLTYEHSQSELAYNAAAILGEAGYYEAGEVDVLAFLDTEIFGEDDVTFKSISISEKQGDFRRAMRMMSGLFGALGGPLAVMFSSALGKDVPIAEKVVLEDDGATGIIDGVRITAGSADYVRRQGITVPAEVGFSAPTTKTMYAAEDGVLFAKFSIQYSFSEEFALMLSALKEENIVPLVYTRDPNLNNELMRFLTGDKDCIRVMKKNTVVPAEEKIYSALESRVAILGDKTDTVNVIMLAKKYCRIREGVSLTELTSSLVGAVLATLIVICNMASAVPSALLAIWQIAWCAALFVMSKRSFSRKRRKKNKK